MFHTRLCKHNEIKSPANAILEHEPHEKFTSSMISNATSQTDYSLEITSEAIHYNRWIYDLMRPYLGARVLELGAGIGVLTPFFLEEDREVLAIDIDARLIEQHRQRVPASSRLTVSHISLQELAAQNAYRQSFDAVVSSNVLEHIPDTTEFEIVEAMSRVLKPGGFAAHWVPAFQCILGSIDASFGHHRRYNRKTAIALFRKAGFNIISCEYWNMPGFFGWWLHGRFAHNKSLPPLSTLAFDRYIVPVLRRVEPWLWRPFGQSLLIVAQR